MQPDVDEASERAAAVLDEIAATVITDRDFLETVLTGILARGHVLLEDVPGTGKTLTARSMATALGLSFSRIQFTPDLLPADVTGTHVFNERDRTFEFNEGPVFANVVLADEINRAPPKTQSALLEAMAERQVTVDGDTRDLPRPFFVLATQNPIEQEGTFPLPEAQVDRFMIKTTMGYPDREGELELINRRADRETQTPSASRVLDPDAVTAMQTVPETVEVEAEVREYCVNLTRATREDRRVETGVSPRGTQRLFEASRARAVLRGRGFVTPDDVKSVAPSVLTHRLVLTPNARVEGVEKATVIDDVLGRIEVPGVDEEAVEHEQTSVADADADHGR